ncbi:hypothetical protein [Egicoccus sp. AB-alg2]|uniref:hypothetical protein n=1 Tax=Egicoccus sp. AB-alg2 TaxID=3242693 RepID=UPI00359DB5EA
MADGEPPHAVGYTIRDGLRAEADDPEQMLAAVDWLVDRAAEAPTAEERVRLLGRAGGYAAIVRDLDRAEVLLSDAIISANRHGLARQAAASRIRLADVNALRGDAATAVQQLTELLHEVRNEPSLDDLLDFVHQHLGKAHLEAGNTAKAVHHLSRALAHREQRGDADLLASTRAALARARREEIT